MAGSLTAFRPISLMWVCGKSSRDGDSPILSLRGKFANAGLPFPKLVIMSLISASSQALAAVEVGPSRQEPVCPQSLRY